MRSRNLAARAGRWSAQHRKKAILGWLAFVIVAFVVGGAVGTKQLGDTDSGNGSSQVADRAIDNGSFPDEADEQVLVQGRGSVKIGDPAFTAAVNDAVARLKAVAHVNDVQSPLAAGNKGQLSKDGRSALVTFKHRRRRRPRRGPRRRRRSPPPPPLRRPTRSCASSSSATPAPTRRSRRPSTTTSRTPSSSRCRSRC